MLGFAEEVAADSPRGRHLVAFGGCAFPPVLELVRPRQATARAGTKRGGTDICAEGRNGVYYYRTYEKAVSGGGRGGKGGHVLRDPTSRGLYVRVWPPHTSERRDSH